jgi:hypothetical protein
MPTYDSSKPRNNPWRARVTIDGIIYDLGCHSSKGAAEQAERRFRMGKFGSPESRRDAGDQPRGPGGQYASRKAS